MYDVGVGGHTTSAQRRQGADIARRLAGICGARFARTAGAADGVAGATARWVAAPGTAEAVTEVLRLAAEHGLSVVARGAGTKLDWGATPSRLDIVLDTGRLAGMWHQPTDEPVAEVGAGTPVRAVQAMLERSGRRLPIDVPSPGATVGGVVASGESGPLRHLHGTPCDQLVGVSYVDASGVLSRAGAAPGEGSTAPGLTMPGSTASGLTASGLTASGLTASGSTAPGSTASGSTASGLTAPGSTASGSTAPGSTAPGSIAPGPTGGDRTAGPGAGHGPAGRPGPDIARLLCGSQGALGVLVSATVRVQAIPASRIWLTRSVWTPLEVHDLVREVLAAELRPTAIEMDLSAEAAPRADPDRRSAWFGHPAGTARPGDRRSREHRRLGAPGAGSLAVLLEGGPADVAERVTRLAALLGGDARAAAAPPAWWRRYPFGPDEVALRIEVPITDLHAAVYALRDAAGAPVPVRGSAGLGVVHAALPATTPPERVAAILDGVRGVLFARSGRCVVVAAPAPIREAVDLWGELPDLPLLRRVKERFDPAWRLAPGRYPGGI